MIFTIIFAALFIISIPLAKNYEKKHKWNVWNWFEFSAVIAGAILLISILFIIVIHINNAGNLEAMNEKREAIVYQLENETYKNANNVGTNELFNDISDFNSDVIRGQAGLNNPWFNWFYASYWRDVEPIVYQ